MGQEFKVEVDMPNLAPDTQVDINEVGLFENGHSKTVELSKEQAELLKDTPGIKVTASEAPSKGGEVNDG